MISATATRAQRLLERATAVLPLTDEELIQKGVAAGIAERLLDLQHRVAQLQHGHGSLEALEKRLRREGVPADDHTLYTDLLEWRALVYERGELVDLLQSL